MALRLGKLYDTLVDAGAGQAVAKEASFNFIGNGLGDLVDPNRR
jgi:hypothetical protein